MGSGTTDEQICAVTAGDRLWTKAFCSAACALSCTSFSLSWQWRHHGMKYRKRKIASEGMAKINEMAAAACVMEKKASA
jgi:hypothetical protein